MASVKYENKNDCPHNGTIISLDGKNYHCSDCGQKMKITPTNYKKVKEPYPDWDIPKLDFNFYETIIKNAAKTNREGIEKYLKAIISTKVPDVDVFDFDEILKSVRIKITDNVREYYFVQPGKDPIYLCKETWETKWDFENYSAGMTYTMQA